MRCPFQVGGWCTRTDCWNTVNGECRHLEETTIIITDDGTNQDPYEEFYDGSSQEGGKQ